MCAIAHVWPWSVSYHCGLCLCVGKKKALQGHQCRDLSPGDLKILRAKLSAFEADKSIDSGAVFCD